MINFNKVQIARRGRGVKDEYFQATTVARQEEKSKELLYDHVKEEHTDSLLEEISKLKNAHEYLAKALDLYLIDKAKAESDPVNTLAFRILTDGILTKDNDIARQKAQALHMAQKACNLDIELLYSQACEVEKNKSK